VTSCDSVVVFLSYHSAHQHCAAKLNEYLTADGVGVWADWERIGRRSDWKTVVARCLPALDLLVAIGGTDYLSSENCVFEWEHASRAGIYRVRLEYALHDLLASDDFGQRPTNQTTERIGRLARRLELYTTSTDFEGRCCAAADA
jgi:hypothetical protein